MSSTEASPLSSTTLDPVIKNLINCVKQDPRTLARLPDRKKIPIIFCALLEEETASSNLGFLLRCIIVLDSPECFNRLVNWARSKEILPTLSLAVFQTLGQGRTGRQLKTLLLKTECIEAAKALSVSVH